MFVFALPPRGRAWPGHPRLSTVRPYRRRQDVDARDEPGQGGSCGRV